VVTGGMSTIALVAAVAVELLATAGLISVAARIYERSIVRIGAPVSLRSALAAGGAAGRHARTHVPPALRQGAAVAALVGGVIVGTSRPAGLVLIATGLLLTVLHRSGRHHPPRPHG
jgi:hypothetical protein